MINSDTPTVAMRTPAELPSCTPPAHDRKTAKSPSWLQASRTLELDQTLRLSAEECARERSVQYWLGGWEYLRSQRSYSILQANLYLMALDGFVNSLGMTIVGTLGPQESFRPVNMSPMEIRIIEISPTQLAAVPNHGLLYLQDRHGAHHIIRVEPDNQSFTITLMTTTLETAEFFGAWDEYVKGHAYLRGQRFYASGEFIKLSGDLKLEAVQLDRHTRAQVEQSILGFARVIPEFKRRKLPCKRGILLVGPPGTGKSLLCRALAAQMKMTFIWVTARHVERSAHSIASIWELARLLSPTALLLEDIDLFAESRETISQSNILGELMNQLDGADENDGILTLATTNRHEIVETALSNRPGRFDHLIHMGPLNKAGRRALIAKWFEGDHVEESLLDYLLHRTEGFTGAQLVEIVKHLIELSRLGNNDHRDDSDLMTSDLIDRALHASTSSASKVANGFMAEAIN